MVVVFLGGFRFVLNLGLGPFISRGRVVIIGLGPFFCLAPIRWPRVSIITVFKYDCSELCVKYFVWLLFGSPSPGCEHTILVQNYISIFEYDCR